MLRRKIVAPLHDRFRAAELKWRSRPLEHPQIVLVSAAAADLFRRSKAAPAVLQFIAKGDCQKGYRFRLSVIAAAIGPAPQ